MIQTVYIISRTTETNTPCPAKQIITVAASQQAAENYIENSYIPYLRELVKQAWKTNDEDIIEMYAPNFVRNCELNAYISDKTKESISIEEFDVINNELF